MKPLSAEELQMNQQAASVAASVVSEAVEAATRCEQATTDMMAGAAGVGAINRGMMRGMKAFGGAMMPSIGGMSKELEGGGLPKSFILAVTASQVYAIEDKHDDGNLVAGKVLKSWDRQGFLAKLSPQGMNAMNGVPDDRQMLVLYLPIEGGKNRYLQAAARNTSAAGSPGMPHKVVVGTDAPSQGLIDTLVTAGSAVPNIMIGGQSLQDMMAQASGGAAAAMAQAAGAAAPAAVDPTERLGKLADLHERGVLTDEEFATQKAKILSEM
jgi:hypothetical protein